MKPVEKIQDIIDRRQTLIDNAREDSDGDTVYPDEVDTMADDVRHLLKEHQDFLPVEFILESLTALGAAPSLLYNDNARWTVGEDGTQPVITKEMCDKETVFDAVWWVGPNRWRYKIREAIADYLAAHQPGES